MPPPESTSRNYLPKYIPIQNRSPSTPTPQLTFKPYYHRVSRGEEKWEEYAQIVERNFAEGKRTPYLGLHRAYGIYSCSHCKHLWGSAGSWADFPLMCIYCRANVYPHYQFKLRKRKEGRKLNGHDRSVREKKHKRELCLRCKILGYSCVTEFY